MNIVIRNAIPVQIGFIVTNKLVIICRIKISFLMHFTLVMKSCDLALLKANINVYMYTLVCFYHNN